MQTLVISPVEYFREQVQKASGSLKIILDQEIEYYVVNLLVEFIDPKEMQARLGGDSTIVGTPMVFLLQKAMNANSEDERLGILKILGDSSLYFSGFFQDYFNNKSFDISYYMQLGKMAFRSLSEQTRQNNAHLYLQMSDAFPQLVDVVAQIADAQVTRKNQDVLAVYDRWVRSNSARLKKILIEMGIDPIQSNLKNAQ